MGLLDPKNTGFFLPLKGFETPRAYITSYMASYMAYSSIEVRLPAISEDKAKEYISFSDDDIDSISSVDTIPSQPYRSPSRSIKGGKGLPKLPKILGIAKEYRPYMPDKPKKLGGDRPREGPLVEDIPHI